MGNPPRDIYSPWHFAFRIVHPFHKELNEGNALPDWQLVRRFGLFVPSRISTIKSGAKKICTPNLRKCEIELDGKNVHGFTSSPPPREQIF